MAEVRLPRSLVELFPGAQEHCTVDAATVAELVAALDRRWPGIRDRLLQSGPRIRPNIHFFVDGESASLATPLRPASRVRVVPALSGG